MFHLAINAAGFGLSNGKLAFLRRPRGREQVAVAVGEARLMPVLGFHAGGALLYARITF